MTKKKKIIIIAICCTVLLIGSAIGIIIATWKRFDLTPNASISYNNHTSLKVVKLPDDYTEVGSDFYTNATTMVKNKDYNYGIYSYIEKDMVVPAKYEQSNIKVVDIKDTKGNILENIFKGTINDGSTLDIAYYTSSGSRLSITEFDSNSNQMYGRIMKKDLSVTLKKKGVKVKSKNDFDSKKIAISDAVFKTAYVGNDYHYEIWEITSKDGDTYSNLYSVSNGKRKLVQTLNNLVGSNIEETIGSVDISQLDWLNEEGRKWVDGLFEGEDYPVYFLKDGTPMIMQLSLSYSNEEDNSLTLAVNIYDINFNLEDTAYVSINENFHTALRVGNNIFIQYTRPASEKKYDYAVVENGITKYYKLETYKLNLKTGSYVLASFDYLINNYNNSFNIETALVHAKKISSKLLGSESLMLLNDQLQTKEINYEFDSITKINGERFIAHGDNGDYLIDEKYNQIAYLGNTENFFTTSDALILSYSEDASTNTYVCDMNGRIIKKYNDDEIENIYDNTYYLVNTTRVIDDNTYEEKYLERLGVRQNTPIHSQLPGSNRTYTYDGKEYIGYSDTISNENEIVARVITRVSENEDNGYTYSFFDMENKLLLKVNTTSSDCSVLALCESDDYILIRITDRSNFETTLLLNK